MRAVEHIHKESPNIALTFKTVFERQPEIEAHLEDEAEQIRVTKESLINGVKEVQALL